MEVIDEYYYVRFFDIPVVVYNSYMIKQLVLLQIFRNKTNFTKRIDDVLNWFYNQFMV